MWTVYNSDGAIFDGIIYLNDQSYSTAGMGAYGGARVNINVAGYMGWI